MSELNELKFINGSIVKVPQSIEELQKELALHPDLIKEAQETIVQDLNSFSEVLGWLAGKLELALDGAYTPQDIGGICDILIKRLRQRRGCVVQIN